MELGIPQSGDGPLSTLVSGVFRKAGQGQDAIAASFATPSRTTASNGRNRTSGLHTYNGVKDTNIVLVGNGGHSVNYCNSVVVDPRDPDAAKRYKMAYWDFAERTGANYPGLCVAFSPDGIHWTKHAEAPLLKAGYSDRGETGRLCRRRRKRVGRSPCRFPMRWTRSTIPSARRSSSITRCGSMGQTAQTPGSM